MTKSGDPKSEKRSALPDSVAEYVPSLDQGIGYLLRAPAHIQRMTNPLFRVRHFVQFRLERLILRGAIARLLVIAIAIGLFALAGGLIAFYLTGAFDDPFASIWWAFLRITDPGYLADDEGTWLRVISVVMTVGGLVLLIGALIAIMTQWLNHTIAQLEQGLTPIVMNNHIVILGWSTRTPAIVEQLLSSEGRVSRFLDTFGGRRLKIVILAETIGPVLIQELKDRLGPHWRSAQVILRSGSPLRLEHLERVDYRHAAAVVLPSEKFRTHTGGDETVIKTLTIAGRTDAGPLPLFVAEIVEADHIRAGSKAYAGPSEIIATGRLSSRVLVQTARHPGLSRILADLFDNEGVQVFLHSAAEYVGVPFTDLMACFESAVPLGVVRGRPGEFLPLLANAGSIAHGDAIAVIGHSFETSRPRPVSMTSVPPPVQVPALRSGVSARRVLILGWNNTVPFLLAECDGYPRAFSEVNVASLKPAAERAMIMKRKGVVIEHVRHDQIDCDVTARADLERLDPSTYDVIMIVASDWLPSAEEADARSLLGYLMLKEILASADRKPHIIIEALVEANAPLFAVPGVELLVTPQLQSHMFAQVTLRRDLNAVFEQLLGVGGAEVSLRPADGITDAADFFELQQRLGAAGEIALGIQRADGSHELNPTKRESLRLGYDDRIIVLTMSAE